MDKVIELEPRDYTRVQPLLQSLDYHLATQALVEGTSPGQVWVDDAAAPRAVLARAGHRYFLAGEPGESGQTPFSQALGRLFAGRIYPEAVAAGDEMFALHYDSPAWEAHLAVILPDRHPIRAAREYYRFRQSTGDWRALLPAGFDLRPADRTLLEDGHIENLDALREEMVSERPSVDDFLAKSFGLCPIYGNQLAGWCLSEYNTADACEIGIASLPPYRRRGLATALTGAFVEEAFSRGVTAIGWHCSARNVPSGATARKAGFQKLHDYSVYLTWFDPLFDLAVNGNVCLDEGRYEQATAWYDRALLHANVPAWVNWGAACAAAHLGRRQAAFTHLIQAIDKGFSDLDRLQSSEHLSGLHGAPEWDALLKRVAK